MAKQKKAYESDQVVELLSSVQTNIDDINKRLEVIYDLGPALEDRQLDELGEILEAVADVIDDFHYALVTYMDGTGIEVEEDKEALEEPTESSVLEHFMEDNLEWENEEEELTPDIMDEEEPEERFLR